MPQHAVLQELLLAGTWLGGTGKVPGVGLVKSQSPGPMQVRRVKGGNSGAMKWSPSRSQAAFLQCCLRIWTLCCQSYSDVLILSAFHETKCRHQVPPWHLQPALLLSHPPESTHHFCLHFLWCLAPCLQRKTSLSAFCRNEINIMLSPLPFFS